MTVLDAPRIRLMELIGEHDTDMKAVSLKIGRNHAYLQQYIQGKPKNLPEDVRDALAEYFGVEPDEFRAPRSQSSHTNASESSHKPRVKPLVSENGYGRLITFDELAVRASAGPGAIADEESVVARWSVPQTLVRSRTNAPAEALKVITVEGDSCEPDFRPGDRVLVNLNDRTPSPPGYFALWDGIGTVIKRLEHVPYSDPPTLKIKSTNPAYEAYERHLAEVSISGRVLGKWHWT